MEASLYFAFLKYSLPLSTKRTFAVSGSRLQPPSRTSIDAIKTSAAEGFTDARRAGTILDSHIVILIFLKSGSRFNVFRLDPTAYCTEVLVLGSRTYWNQATKRPVLWSRL